MDKISNKYIRGSFCVINITGKMQDSTLKYFEHFERKNNDNIIKKTGEIRVVGNRERDRLKKK